MRQKRSRESISEILGPDRTGRRPWLKAMPSRMTRYCDGRRVPDRSMVGTRLETPQDHSCTGQARIAPRPVKHGVQKREIAPVRDRLRDDSSGRRPWGLGCHSQRHRGRGRCALDIPLHRRISSRSVCTSSPCVTSPDGTLRLRRAGNAASPALRVTGVCGVSSSGTPYPGGRRCLMS